jgi:hypothetical protein
VWRFALSEPEQPATQNAEDFLSPASFIRAAKAAHPAFRYAMAVAGILAIVVSFVKFGVGYATLVFGAIAIIGLMVLFLVFAQASKLTKSTLDVPAQVLVWACLVIAIVIVVFLTSSLFFSKPLPFRDWIIQEFSKKPNNVVVPPVTPPVNPGNDISAEKEIVISELTDAYKATGWKLAFFDSWGHPPTLQLLRVNQGMLVATTVDGKRTVSLSIDPRQLPTPQHYNAYVGQISSLGSKEGPAVVRFFTAYEQFRDTLVSLTSNPADFTGAFINANVAAREAVTRGRLALCALGTTPPRLFREEPGGFPEPVPPNCSETPF